MITIYFSQDMVENDPQEIEQKRLVDKTITSDKNEKMLKVKSHPDYSSEEGRYNRGNDFSPVAVAKTIQKFQRDIIITHSCGAMWSDNVLIVMDAQQTVAVCQTAPISIVIATHMESEYHSTISRRVLRSYAQTHGSTLINC
jgi:hypothetical protein